MSGASIELAKKILKQHILINQEEKDALDKEDM